MQNTEELTRLFELKKQGALTEDEFNREKAKLLEKVSPSNIPSEKNSTDSFWKIYIIAILFGLFGVHRFMTGKIKTGFLQLITLGGFGIWTFIDLIKILLGKFNDKNGLAIRNTSPKSSWAIIIILLGLSFSRNSSTSQSSTISATESPSATTTMDTSSVAAPSANVPQEQVKFIAAIVPFIEKYDSAPNELKKSALRDERKKSIASALNSLEFKDWIGTIKTMETTGDGNAHLQIKLAGSEIVIENNNNEFSAALGDSTLIKKGTELFNKVADLSEGQNVKINGQFLMGEKDYIQEDSITENGSMTDPAFEVKYLSVDKF